MVNPELLLAFATRDEGPGAVGESGEAVMAAIVRSFVRDILRLGSLSHHGSKARRKLITPACFIQITSLLLILSDRLKCTRHLVPYALQNPDLLYVLSPIPSNVCSSAFGTKQSGLWCLTRDKEAEALANVKT